jgi:hypothetical protein
MVPTVKKDGVSHSTYPLTEVATSPEGKDPLTTACIRHGGLPAGRKDSNLRPPGPEDCTPPVHPFGQSCRSLFSVHLIALGRTVRAVKINASRRAQGTILGTGQHDSIENRTLFHPALVSISTGKSSRFMRVLAPINNVPRRESLPLRVAD